MTTPRRPHRALLVLTGDPVDDAHGNDPWSVFTTEGWTVDVTCIAGRSPGPPNPGAPLRAPWLERLGTPGRPGLNGAIYDSADFGQADRDGADRDCADYDLVCFIDGHTTTWASPRSPDLSRLMGRISEYGEIIAAVRPGAFDWLEEISLRDR
jgi:putative intracellular protease/amidase